MVDQTTVDEIVKALSKIVERLNSNEIRLRSLEEGTTTALKRLNVIEEEIKRSNRSISDKSSEINEKVETLGLKYVELAKLAEKLVLSSKSAAQTQEIERLRTLVEVLK